MLDFSLLGQIFVALFTVNTLLQPAAIQSFMQPISDSLIQFVTTTAQVAPKIVPALVLVGIGLLTGKVMDWIVRKIVEKLNHATFFCHKANYWDLSWQTTAKRRRDWESSRNKHSLSLTVLLMRHLHLLLILAEESKNKLLKENQSINKLYHSRVAVSLTALHKAHIIYSGWRK